jgi:hypothetical protein
VDVEVVDVPQLGHVKARGEVETGALLLEVGLQGKDELVGVLEAQYEGLFIRRELLLLLMRLLLLLLMMVEWWLLRLGQWRRQW